MNENDLLIMCGETFQRQSGKIKTKIKNSNSKKTAHFFRPCIHRVIPKKDQFKEDRFSEVLAIRALHSFVIDPKSLKNRFVKTTPKIKNKENHVANDPKLNLDFRKPSYNFMYVDNKPIIKPINENDD